MNLRKGNPCTCHRRLKQVPRAPVAVLTPWRRAVRQRLGGMTGRPTTRGWGARRASRYSRRIRIVARAARKPGLVASAVRRPGRCKVVAILAVPFRPARWHHLPDRAWPDREQTRPSRHQRHHSRSRRQGRPRHQQPRPCWQCRRRLPRAWSGPRSSSRSGRELPDVTDGFHTR